MKYNIFAKYLFVATVAVVSLLTASCSEEKMKNDSFHGGQAVIMPKVTSYPNEAEVENQAGEITSLYALLFENGNMTHMYQNINPTEGVRLETDKGRLYMVANLSTSLMSSLADVGMSEDEWLKAVVTHEGGVNLTYMSGVLDLEENTQGVLMLNRGVARIDVKVSGEYGLAVQGIVFRNVAKQSFLNKQVEIVTPDGAGFNDVTPEIETSLTGNTTGVAYLCEQASENLSAVLTIAVNGEVVEKEVMMPSVLKRNAVYTLNVFKASVEADVTVNVTNWENGGDYDLAPNERNIRLDIDGTLFPADTEIDADGRGFVLAHRQADFILSIDCDDELEFIADPELPMTVERIGGPENVGKNLFRISKNLWHPGMKPVEKKLMFHRKGLNENYPQDYINVVMTDNPVKLQGLINFDKSSSCDFDKYIENELGILTVPDAKKVTVEYDEGEDPWIKLDASGNTTRILAGWRPNDKTANGRVQSARLVITNSADGSEREEYVISRRNWGLPVTFLNGVWWCKYNAMGDSKNFADQILSSADPAVMAGKTLFDYLSNCTADEFFNLWKWNFQGKSTQGLQVIDDGGVAKMEGYSSSTVHINKLDAKAMAPDGYELPSMENFDRVLQVSTAGQYIWLMWDGSHKTAWNGGCTIQRRQRRRNDVTVGTVALTDLIYISMYNTAESGYEPLVWYGSSTQWDNNGIKHGHYNNMLFAVYNPTDGMGWYFAGAMDCYYAGKNSAGSNDTRVLRFKKSDVEYIY